jgi:branched-chain amino acid transport system permease protein
MQPEYLLQFFISGVTNGSIYALIAIGFSITFGATKLINFAQGEFGMLGGFIAVTLLRQLGLPLIVALPFSICIVAALGGILERVTLRPFRRATHLQLVTITLGTGVLLKAIAVIVWGKDATFLPAFSGETPFEVAGATITPQSLWIIGAACVAVLLLALFYARTAWGKATQAAAMNPSAAHLVGIPVETIATVAFAVAAGMGALAGVLIAPVTAVHFNVGTFMGLKGFAAAALGGLGSFPGAIIGGLMLGLLESFGAGLLSSGYKNAIALGVVILVLMARPAGIIGSIVGNVEEA